MKKSKSVDTLKSKNISELSQLMTINNKPLKLPSIQQSTSPKNSTTNPKSPKIDTEPLPSIEANKDPKPTRKSLIKIDNAKFYSYHYEAMENLKKNMIHRSANQSAPLMESEQGEKPKIKERRIIPRYKSISPAPRSKNKDKFLLNLSIEKSPPKKEKDYSRIQNLYTHDESSFTDEHLSKRNQQTLPYLLSPTNLIYVKSIPETTKALQSSLLGVNSSFGLETPQKENSIFTKGRSSDFLKKFLFHGTDEKKILTAEERYLLYHEQRLKKLKFNPVEGALRSNLFNFDF